MSQVPLTPVNPPQPRSFFARWQVALICATTLVVLVGLAWLVGYVKNLLPSKFDPRAEKRDEYASPVAPGPPKREPPVPTTDNDSPAPKREISPRTKEESTRDREAADALRPALGAFTVIGIRQAYLNVGLLADGVEGDVYEVADALEVLDQVVTDLATVDRLLEQLTEKAFEAEDREAVTLARKALRLLRTQAKALRAYWENTSKELAKELAEQFQKAREASREALEELLALDD